MRERLRQVYDQSFSELRGISALGTKLRVCFYSLDKNLESIILVTSLAIPRNEAYINDTAPVDGWNSDTLTDDGYKRFMGVCEEVKTLAAVEATLKGMWPFFYEAYYTYTFDI